MVETLKAGLDGSFPRPGTGIYKSGSSAMLSPGSQPAKTRTLRILYGHLELSNHRLDAVASETVWPAPGCPPAGFMSPRLRAHTCPDLPRWARQGCRKFCTGHDLAAAPCAARGAGACFAPPRPSDRQGRRKGRRIAGAIVGVPPSTPSHRAFTNNAGWQPVGVRTALLPESL